MQGRTAISIGAISDSWKARAFQYDVTVDKLSDIPWECHLACHWVSMGGKWRLKFVNRICPDAKEHYKRKIQ